MNIVPAAERFWKKVQKHDDGCWLWTAGTDGKGYGQFRIRLGLKTKAHRFSYELAHGPIPKADEGYHGWCVLHRCDNPACVRPEHLMLGTHQDNMRDMWQKGRCKMPPQKQTAPSEASR